jgi:hypothetical protein
MITLADDTITVTLPDDILWADEFTWSPVQQTVDHTLTGALVLQVAERQAGRPVTLQSGRGPYFACIERADLDKLLAWAFEPGQELTLTIRGAPRAVVFRHQDGQVIEAEMLMYHAAPVDSTLYAVTVRLMEV